MIQYDEEISRVNAAIMDLLTWKNKLEREGRTDPEYGSRVAAIASTLERADSAELHANPATAANKKGHRSSESSRCLPNSDSQTPFGVRLPLNEDM